MRRTFLFVTSHPVVILSIAALVGLVFGLQILRLTRDPSPDAFIPKDHEAWAMKQRVDETFGLHEPIVVAVIRDAPDGIFTAHTLRLIQELTEAIQALPRVDREDVYSLATESGIYFKDGEPEFERLMPDVPRDDAARDALREDVLSYELYRGTLVAEDGSAACIIVRLAGDQDGDAMYRAIRDLLPDVAVRDERIVIAGEAAVRAHMGAAVSDDAVRMNFVCPVIMALLIVLAYRTGRGTVLPLCVIGGASALALGLMSVFGVPIYIVTNGIFVIIMALGVADSLHLVGQYYEEQLEPRGRDKQQIIVDACLALWYPLLITSLTDVAGFFSLYLVGIMPPIRYFGLFTCVGVLGALAFSYTVVPAGLMILPLKMSRAFGVRRSKGVDPTREGLPLDFVGRAMGRLGECVYKHRVPVLALSILAVAVAGWGASKLIVNDARILAFKDDHPIVRATEAINARFDGTSALNIVVTAQEKGAFLSGDLLRRIDALEAYTETLEHVGGTHSLAGWVKRAHQKMNKDDPAFYVIPDDPAETQFYLDVLSGAGSPMARHLREVIDASYTEANLIVRMTSSEYIHQREVIRSLQSYLAGWSRDASVTAELAGRVNLDYHWVSLVRTSHVRSVCLSFLCVVVLTGLMFRSAVAGILCALTVGVAVLVNYAVMGWGGIPLGVGTSMFASIAIGAGVNFPIHILDRLRVGHREPGQDISVVFRDALGFTGRALFFTAMVVTIGFLLLCVSEFRTLVNFGLLVAVGMLMSFLASVTLLPAAVAVLRPGFLRPLEGSGEDL